MLKIENINKTFGDQQLFEDLSISINKNEKVGLVGRNGHGKTTLLKMIIREVEPDFGEISIPKNYRIGYLQQHISFSKKSLLDEAILGLPDEDKHNTWKAKKILTGLGFSEDNFEKSPTTFSGGYQLRINLAKVLLGNPDLLLLDEPNNYLDIVAIRWLENFLKTWPNEILLITHDRSFMDNIITHTVCIHRKKAKKIEGDTSKLYQQIEQEEEIYEKTRLNEEKKRKQTELFITKFRAKARLGGLVQSRVKALEKIETKDKLEQIESLDFSFRYSGFNATQMLEANNICFDYNINTTEKLIKNFNLTIDKTDRIAIIGKNGKGKSTLLRILSGNLMPNFGIIKKHNNLSIGYFAQTNLATLFLEKTIVEEFLSADPDSSIQKCRAIAGLLMFSGDLALKKIKILSGGEKSRVMLGKILLTPSNLLLLDEPTNHLDMDSSEALLDAINSFEGAVVMVTHNELYLKNFATRLIIFDNNEITIFNGTYNEFLERIGWADEMGIKISSKKSVLKNNKKDLKKQRAEINQAKGKALKPINDEIQTIEINLNKLEIEFEEINNNLIIASTKLIHENIKKYTQLLTQTRKIIDEKYLKLDELYKQKEIEDEKFKKMIEELEIGKK